MSLGQLIREKYQLGHAQHMTHLRNLESIFQTGGLYSHNRMHDKSYHKIDNDDVQAARASITVDVSGRPLHDYVPLYFGWKTPMLASNQHQNESIVLLRVSLDLFAMPGVVFTDGNARTRTTKFYLFRSIDDLDHVNVKATNVVTWGDDLELKRQKQAEILLPDFMPIDKVADIMCFCNDAQDQVLALTKKFGMDLPARVNPGHYFRDFTQGAK